MLALPFRDGEVPTEAEIRIAKAQLVGWLEGLFHGIQATLFAQQLAARQQLEQMRQLPPARCPACRPGPGQPGQPDRTAPARTSERSPAAPTVRDDGATATRHRCDRHGPVLGVDDRGDGGLRRANHMRRLVHPPPRPHRVLDARRRGPARRAGGQGGGRRAAGDRHHRPRQHVRDPRVLQGVPASRASSRSSAPRPTWPTTTAASARPAGAASTTPAATPRAARSSTTTSPCWPRTTPATAT